MTTILPNGVPLETLQAGSYVVTDPDTGLDSGTYRIEVRTARNAAGASFNLQDAYQIDTGAAWFRANLSSSTADWTEWLPRSGSGSDITASAIVSKLDTFFGSAAWRTGTSLDITDRNSDVLDVTSSTGDAAAIPSATVSEAGLISADDLSSLRRLALDAVPPLTFVAGAPIIAPQVVAIADDGRARPFNLSDIPADAIRTLGRSLNDAGPNEPVRLKIMQFAEEE